MDPEHGNPAVRLVWAQLSKLNHTVAGALQDLHAAGIEPNLKLAAFHMDAAIRQMVSDGDWAEAGITDVRELYDLQVTIVPGDGRWAICITMPNVINQLLAQDDPDAN